jgi:ribosomal protein S18 acetylase RimI-like enzyme
MTAQIEISPLEVADLDAIVALWNNCLTAHPITKERLASLFFSEANGKPKLKLASFVAKTDQIVGFVFSYQRNQPAAGLGVEPDLGYLSAIAVTPNLQGQQIGSKLLQAAINQLGATEILICGRTGSAPAAVFPGVDLDNYPAAVKFFERHGFAELAKAHSMSSAITQPVELTMPAEVSFAQQLDLDQLAEFIAAAFPGDWAEVAIAKAKSNPAEFGVITVNGSYAGFAVWNQGWFGPVGVAEEFRSYGLGSMLVKNAINQMHKAGVDRIWFNWADEWVVPFYQRLGFEINRSYQRMNYSANQ